MPTEKAKKPTPKFSIGDVVEVKARWTIVGIDTQPDGGFGYRLEHSTDPQAALFIREDRLRKAR
jgi:hypothetical protein